MIRAVRLNLHTSIMILEKKKMVVLSIYISSIRFSRQIKETCILFWPVSTLRDLFGVHVLNISEQTPQECALCMYAAWSIHVGRIDMHLLWERKKELEGISSVHISRFWNVFMSPGHGNFFGHLVWNLILRETVYRSRIRFCLLMPNLELIEIRFTSRMDNYATKISTFWW